MIFIQVFGTVCIDKIRIIDSFPNVLGTYTEVLEERIGLGGEASNTFVCMSRWLVEDSKNNKNGKKKLKLISTPIVNDIYGNIIKEYSYFKESKESSDVIIDLYIKEPCDDLKFTPSCDLYICSMKERTMFGIGYKENDRFVGNNKEELLNNRIEFKGNQYWISFDYNTPISNEYIIKKSVETSTNMFILDHDFSLVEYESNFKENLEKMNIIYQISTDFTATQKDKVKSIEFMTNWLQEHKGCLMILTDGGNGLGYGGEIYNGQSQLRETIPIQWLDPFQIDNIIDSTGSGDCFRAGFLYQISEHSHISSSNLLSILKFSSASGGLNCQSVGGCTNTPSLSKIINLLNNKSKII